MQRDTLGTTLATQINLSETWYADRAALCFLVCSTGFSSMFIFYDSPYVHKSIVSYIARRFVSAFHYNATSLYITKICFNI